jgi:transcriptional regulator with XRE-family HTH domain
MESMRGEPSIRCLGCNLVQFVKPGKTKCRRCGRDFVPVEVEPKEEIEIPVLNGPFIRRLETCLCLTIKHLRYKAKLKQHQIAKRGNFGSRVYVSKVENPLGPNRTIPSLKSIEKFATALDVDIWKIISLAERQAARTGCNDWYQWWDEIVPLLRILRHSELAAILTAARQMSEPKKMVATDD